ncbi:L,D-transpeptidase [Legionella genomosp. 1]|uniref:L,D-transpeptidase family protein n=1 Tax=Legionella genomosp. 1 TaxID=1093625 RepID=UPI0010542299|nr:L,D-transpeptidase family protein [Legionella genomosp. 1]
MKIEGDKKTPAGLFRIHNVFASNPMSLRMDTRFVTKEDKFIDDVNSSEYNTWITGPTTANSYEPMLIDIYRMGAVIDYNTSPIIPGKGSAIFLHIWRSENQGTHGCIAMEEKNLQLLLQWLDKNKNPSILIISKTTLNSRRLELPNK